MECRELPSDIQIKQLIASLYQVPISPILPEKQSLASQSCLVCVIALWPCIHLDLFSRMSHRESKISSKISDQQLLETSLRTVIESQNDPGWKGLQGSWNSNTPARQGHQSSMFTRLGCPRPHPTWPWTPPPTGHPQHPWEAFSRTSPLS